MTEAFHSNRVVAVALRYNYPRESNVRLSLSGSRPAPSVSLAHPPC